MTAQRTFDVISLGCMTLELRAQQRGARLEDATSFARHVGGASASIAFGCARLGLRTAMVSRVGDDAAGRFLVEALAAEGCDVSRVAVDRERATSLDLLASGGSQTYRDNSADLAIEDGAADEAFIASARALVLTGTHFSTESTDHVSSLALERARRHDVRTVLAIDGGAEVWTPRRAGTNLPVASGAATTHLQSLLSRFDLIVGTQAELQLAGGSDDLLEALRAIRRLTTATLVLELGAAGCAILDGDVPGRLADVAIPGFATTTASALDAGSAFLAGLVKGWLGGMEWRAAGRLANACSALVASRDGGSAAMPSAAELAHFLSGAPTSDPQLARLHRAAPRRRAWDDVIAIAIDERAEAFDLARAAGAPETRPPQLKKLLVRAVAEAEQAGSLQGHVGVLVDDTYGEDALASAGRGWWLARPVEVSGSLPLELEGGRSIGSRLVAWPRDHVVKCRVQFHPDAPVEERLEQETQLTALYRAVQTSGHELLLEVVLPTRPPRSADAIERAIKRLYNIGIHPEWWSLEAMAAQTWSKLDALIAERDPHCRGVLALDPGELAAAAASRSCRGILVGATAFRAASTAWLAGTIDDDTLVARARAAFEARVQAWRRARPDRKAAS